ncbi:MAG: hypothetical protein O7J95_10010 [Planctomycetota bacterium]|nr:hypothetical protein [Planctomycetota bacterium]
MTANLRAAGGDLIKTVDLLGGTDVVDVALDAADGTFWVLGESGIDAETHRIFHIDQNLNVSLPSIPNPHPPGNIGQNNLTTNRGVAYHALTNNLFVLSSIGPRLSQIFSIVQVNKATGVTVGASFIVTPPDGDANLFGLSYDLFNRQFWTLDTRNDKLLRVDTTGRVTHSITLQEKSTPFTVLHGRGVAFGINASQPRLYVPIGDIFSAGPSRIAEVTVTGRLVDGTLISEPTGVEIPLSQIPDQDLRGLDLFSKSNVNPRDRVIVVGSQGRLYEIDRTISNPRPPTGLVCSLTLRNEVSLSWENQGSGLDGSYGATGVIQVLRSGVPLTTLPGDATSFVDTTPIQGTSAYSLRASLASGAPFSDPSCECQAAVGPGGLVSWRPFPGNSIVDVAENPTSGLIFATDDQASKIYLFDADLNAIGEVDAPSIVPGGIAYVPSIILGFPPQPFDDMLAIGEAVGNRVRFLRAGALNGPPVTTLTLNFSNTDVETPRIASLTYDSFRGQLIALEHTTRQIYRFDNSGNLVDFCRPLLIETPMDRGITYDALQDSLLVTFEWGVVREIRPNCAPALFDAPFLLGGLGPAFDTPDFTGGIQISGSTMLVAGVGANAVYRLLIFPFSPTFIRGDFNGDTKVNITDAVGTAEYLFQGGVAPDCDDAADSNDDGILDVSDPIFLLFALFIPGSPSPPPPFPEPGDDPTFRDNLGCRGTPVP